MHPQLCWTTRLGTVLDRDADGNTNGSLVWLEQRLEDPGVTGLGKTAILAAIVVD